MQDGNVERITMAELVGDRVEGARGELGFGEGGDAVFEAVVLLGKDVPGAGGLVEKFGHCELRFASMTNGEHLIQRLGSS